MVIRHLAVSFYVITALKEHGAVMYSYQISQIGINILFILIPLHYVLREESSRRTKRIAGVILGFVVLGLIGQLGAKLAGVK